MDRVQRTALEHPAFDLTSHWRRGGFRESLTAGSDRDSAAFLDRLIANDLFVLPGTTLRGVEIRRDRFLRLIARYNGHQLESLRRRTGWDRPTFDHVIGSLIAQDAIFTLPFEPVIAERSNLYYFRDTGILHRLFNPKWTAEGFNFWAPKTAVRTACSAA